MIEGLANNSEYLIIVALVASITQNVKQTSIPSKWLPFVAMGVGAIAGVCAAYITKDTNYLGGALQGVITALGTSGGVDAAKAVTSQIMSKKTEGDTQNEAK